MREALILVDLQNDFMPGGALAVRDGDQVAAPANRLADAFDLVVATQDWHPRDHESFAASHPGKQPGEVVDLHGLPQVLWPVHCVQDTPGADFHPALNRARITKVIRKGQDRQIDSYSGFFDNGRRHATGLADFLREQGVTTLYVLGLATDYCVKWTAIDAVRLGFTTWLVEDACRGVGLQPGDIPAALAEMQRAGVARTTVEAVLRRRG
ncbi:MAG: Nicotinamidase [Candidatus Ozemobacter sibiricus]|uniref:Nicotinamidase n=1 Tax=Candidatus Ozemobacter sibiricus TaxID=2268124 RepID=A0A367ZTI0_9BACT|nr:MAG: Nicotinamidase [Candidatus Ozemobacter sibiricus]